MITYINVRGIQMVGKFATALELFILLPVLVLVVIGLAKWHHNPFVPVVPPHQPTFNVFGVGLALGLWLYSGYEQCSTVAEEVENPRRTYPLALALVVPHVYRGLFSAHAGLARGARKLGAVGTPDIFPTAAQLIGGPWLGAWMTLRRHGYPRRPAQRHYPGVHAHALRHGRRRLPAARPHRKHPRYGTPWTAIITSSAVYALLALHSLLQLIAIYNWLRVATTVMTVVAAWQLRRKKPDMPRPFVIPGGRAGLFDRVVAVIIMSAVALLGSDRYGLIWGPVALAVGPLVYFALRRGNMRSA